MKFNELEKVWTSNKSPCYLGLTLFPPFLFHCVKLRLLLLLSAASTTKKIGLRSDGSRSCAIRNTTTSECVCRMSLFSSTPHFQLGKEGCQHSMVKHHQKPKQTIYQLSLLLIVVPHKTRQYILDHQRTLCSSCSSTLAHL